MHVCVCTLVINSNHDFTKLIWIVEHCNNWLRFISRAFIHLHVNISCNMRISNFISSFFITQPRFFFNSMRRLLTNLYYYNNVFINQTHYYHMPTFLQKNSWCIWRRMRYRTPVDWYVPRGNGNLLSREINILSKYTSSRKLLQMK